MDFEHLNKMVQYIEEHLDKEIDLNHLSHITHTHLFILERIFIFLTGMTLKQYIKKRRLSKAFEEIRNTNNKIIDIAFKYQFNSSSSFNRAFKQMFNLTPSECRKSVGEYKIVPIEYFESSRKKYNFDYQIKEIECTTIYCYHVTAKQHNELLYKIKELYRRSKINKRYEEFSEVGLYGVFLKNNHEYHYYLGSKKYFSDLEGYTIKKGQFAVFKLLSREQEDIVDLEERIIRQWIPSVNYTIESNTKIEYYIDDSCSIYLPIE